MTRDEALDRLYQITEGIADDEVSNSNGWWETSTGANFGLEKLKELERLIEELTP